MTELYSNLNRRKCLYLPDNYDFVTQHQDFEAWFLHSLEWQRVLARKERIDYIPMSAKYMQAVCHDYKRVIDHLKMANVIEVLIDNGIETYTQGVVSKSYRLHPKYHEATYRRHQGKLALEHKPTFKAPVHKVLWQWLKKLEVVDNRGNYALMAIEDGKLFLNPCDYYRVHTNLTNLDSELKQYLRYKGEKLVQLDIINSQPTFLSLLLSDSSSDCSYSSPSLQSNPSFSSSYISSLPTLCHYVSKTDRKSLQDKDLGRFGFIEDCCSGKLYEKLSEKTQLDRKTVKTMLYREILFGKNKYTWEGEDEGTRFRAAFYGFYPDVYDIVTEVKRKDYRHLAHMLQRTEAKVVIHQVCPAIRAFDSKIPFWTIHDSIITSASQADTVERIFNEELSKLVIKPMLKREAL